MGNPIISIDSKKKENLGSLYRDGKSYSQSTIESYDHDYPYLSDGKVCIFGVYDIQENSALVYIGRNNDTGEFACDAIFTWWQSCGRMKYPQATSILILADS